MRTRHLATLAAGILSIAIGGCSSSTENNAGTGGKVNPPAGTGGQTPAGTGGSGTGGVVAGTGGATTGTGGATTGTGGATTGSGGKTTGTGGKTTGSGGSETGGKTGAGGAAADGGSSGGGSSGRPDAGSMGGRGSGGATGPVGTGGGGGGTTVPTVDGGGSSSGPSAGCGKSTTKPNRKTQQTMDVGGTTRYYLLNVPSSADSKTPLPLVFALHGYDMNNVALVDLYDFTSESGNKAITVLPQGEGPDPGTTSHWGDQVLKSTWSGTTSYSFIQQLKAYILDNFCVDTGRVFISGFSMGGMFTNSMACDHNDWFRGYAPVEGGGPGSCAQANAKPAIIIHQGTADTIATPAKGGEPTRDFWTKQNGCNTTTTSIYTGCLSYGACEEPVLYCTGNWTHTVDRIARANIWKFFDTLK